MWQCSEGSDDVAVFGRSDYEHLIPYGNQINIGNLDKREVHGKCDPQSGRMIDEALPSYR